jgi:hypothetical protein
MFIPKNGEKLKISARQEKYWNMKCLCLNDFHLQKKTIKKQNHFFNHLLVPTFKYLR